MFRRPRTGSTLCPSCGKLVGVNDEVTTPQLWMHLQADWDLHQALRKDSAA